MSIETHAIPSEVSGSGQKPVSISLVMPGYNEADCVEEAIGRAIEGLESCTDTFEIIVVNDGSTDATGAIADTLAAQDARIRVLHNERNVNYGVSLKRGIEASRCEWILHNGMDLPLAPEDFEEFIPYFDRADVIVVRRTDCEAHSSWRKLTSWGNKCLLKALFRPRSRDLNFVQFYRASVVKKISLESTSPAFTTPELILRCERAEERVLEVSAEFRRRQSGVAHFGKAHDILWTLRDMMRFRIRTWRKGWEL